MGNIFVPYKTETVFGSRNIVKSTAITAFISCRNYAPVFHLSSYFFKIHTSSEPNFMSRFCNQDETGAHSHK